MRLTVCSLLGLLLLAGACEPTGSTEPVATATHALLRVDRSARVGAETEATGVAFAGIVRVPELADPELLLRLSGKGPTLPAPGQCMSASHERDVMPAGDLGRAEFLDAGDVLLGTTAVQTLLAPRAFPLLPAEPLSGVVYTSRDRASAPLPGGASYLLKTTGSDQLPGLELRVQAPEELRDVTVAGAPFDRLPNLDGSTELGITWRAGDARDLVYVEVSGATAGSLGLCAFHDADGRGVLPQGLFGATGQGSLAFHRLREVAADVPALDGAEVRFDFALTAETAFR